MLEKSINPTHPPLLRQGVYIAEFESALQSRAKIYWHYPSGRAVAEYS